MLSAIVREIRTRPQLDGRWSAHTSWLFHWMSKAEEAELQARWCRDLPGERFVRFLGRGSDQVLSTLSPAAARRFH